MNLDLEKALTYIKQDPNWVNKLFAGVGILLMSFAIYIIPLGISLFSQSTIVIGAFGLMSFIVSTILCLALAGYFVQVIHRRIIYANTFLPDWNEFFSLLVTGLKYFTGYFLYLLPLILYTTIFVSLLMTILKNSTGFEVTSFLLLTMLGTIFLLGLIFIAVFTPLMMSNFFYDLKIISFTDYKQAFGLLKGNVGNYCILLLLFVAISILGQIVCSLLVVTVIGIIFIPVLYFYLYLVSAGLFAQFVVIAKNKN